MTLYERVEELAKKQKISIFDLAIKLGLSRNAIYSWKNSSPKAETLEIVADYFGVSTDYLLDREIKDDLSIEGRAIGRDYDALTPRNQELFKKMLAALQEDDPEDDWNT